MTIIFILAAISALFIYPLTMSTIKKIRNNADINFNVFLGSIMIFILFYFFAVIAR